MLRLARGVELLAEITCAATRCNELGIEGSDISPASIFSRSVATLKTVSRVKRTPRHAVSAQRIITTGLALDGSGASKRLPLRDRELKARKTEVGGILPVP